ncbi:Murein DD-endopeptidase MepM and murein hydrolase activator NlpD, contain LysM domain [Cetobacterium ceti]|uniref:Murein DD-endopeptidase MepM and murein hydrolase activator NlpD, contain LysM domain n=1 Tax=Cetobacterium ceti TaxID=180163 RepID=A0A1T4N1G4_9FUSO|nr:M23 family metallopeptidase [Cetobacterium ceti]SJZ72825.1 Murein DD-endopeptidase MepM and murein hydrolase activator NlpD, contain LysM domain [Cetobacterium ceti]
MKARTTIVKSIVLSLCIIGGIYFVSKNVLQKDKAKDINNVKKMIMVDENKNNDDETMGEENENLIAQNKNDSVVPEGQEERDDTVVATEEATQNETTTDNESIKENIVEAEPAENIISNIGYKIQQGDTIYDLAKKYNTSSEYIFANNKNKNLRILRIGEEIEIPNQPGFFYKIEKGDSFYSIQKEFNVSEDTIKKDNGIDNLIAGGTIFLRNPTIPNSFKNKLSFHKGKNGIKVPYFANPLHMMHITSGFGMRDHPVLKRILRHGGLDLRAHMGTNVMAARQGVVTYAGRAGTYGNLVIIKHNNGYETRYAHLSRIKVHVGERVYAREEIALSGETGRVTGPHLHFEIRKNGKVLNPIEFLAFK